MSDIENKELSDAEKLARIIMFFAVGEVRRSSGLQQGVVQTPPESVLRMLGSALQSFKDGKPIMDVEPMLEEERLNRNRRG